MHHFSVQRMQNSSARNDLTGQPDLFSAEQNTLNIGAQLQRDRHGPNIFGQMAIHSYNEVPGSNGTRPSIQDENQSNLEKDQYHEQDMEIGYDDNPTPLTFEGLEQRFLDEIMKLASEQRDAEEAENTRHKEKILEINTKYQESYSALRAQQAARREEFLHKESQARLDQYHQDGRNRLPNMRMPTAHGNVGPGTSTGGEAIKSLAAGQYKPHGGQTPSFASGRGSEAKVPLPPGRVYNNRAGNH